MSLTAIHSAPRIFQVRSSTGTLTEAPAVRNAKVCFRSLPRRRSDTARGTIPQVQRGSSAPTIEASSIVWAGVR